MDSNLQRYSEEEKITRTLGPKIAAIISGKLAIFPDNISDQYAGHDVICNWTGDFKWDMYKNDNIVIETYNGHHLHTAPYWEDMDDSNLIIYIKCAQNYFIAWTAAQIKEFAKTELFANRKEYGVKGNGTMFKNFRLGELPKPIISSRFTNIMSLNYKDDKLGDKKYVER